jgi:hypothetical protein
MVGLHLRLLAFRIPPGLSVCHNRAVTGQTRKSGEWFQLTDANRFAASEIAVSGSRVERVDDVGRDAAARRHIVPVTTGPIADRGALLTVDGPAAPPCAGTPAAPTSNATAGRYPLLQIAAQFRGILGRKVNLIGHPVKPEFDCFVGGAGTIEIIDQSDRNFLRH